MKKVRAAHPIMNHLKMKTSFKKKSHQKRKQLQIREMKVKLSVSILMVEYISLLLNMLMKIKLVVYLT